MLAEFVRLAPKTEEELLLLLGEKKPNTVIYNGGTDILVYLRSGKMIAERLIDIKGVPGLSDITEKEDCIRIGACATFSEIASHPAVRAWYPALAAGCASVGGPQIRNKATLAGNIVTAAPSGDGQSTVFGLDGCVVLRSMGAERRVPVREFILGFRKTSMAPDEYVSAIEMSKRKWSHQAFFKVGRRNALAISVMNGAVAVDTENGIVTDARIALGSAAPTAIRLYEAERALIGKKLCAETAQQIAQLVQDNIHPRSSIRAGGEYRRYIAGVHVKEALEAFMEEEAHD